MKLTSPTGTKHITLSAGEALSIFLEDNEPGSREFHLEINLEGENATCSVQGRAQSFGNDRKVWIVKQNFRGKNQTGEIELRGTAEGESFLQFDGAATLEQSSTQAEANISERVILFDQARGKLLPVLRVETDDVKAASHGATIAPVEPEKILYLTSRGIKQKEAERLIKEGFLK